MNKLIYLFLLFDVLALTAIFYFCFQYIQLLVPLHPKEPYFFSSYTRYPYTGWQVADFQPVYLWSYKYKEKYLLKAAYRDEAGKVKFIDIFAGGRYQDKVFPLSFYDSKMKKMQEYANFKEFKDLFRFGQRIKASFFTVFKTPGGVENAYYCQKTNRLCQLIEELDKENDKERYALFWKTGSLAGNKILPVWSLSFDINKNEEDLFN